ncbi:hypothetical protein GFS24_03190 [Chitinophaga sp. SYP-B3965]|uniref:hypothetical protein n=1 Tax=Chitinophaga sp. SYP-B3965 TaxID=2663120 RepID=UPI0012999111|nr:hypothetical protein [Chitinophaga sp. SYP-B3965]MRG44099.1 hypothetical protein [Chitinophaga sp. SYP-B3965]
MKQLMYLCLIPLILSCNNSHSPKPVDTSYMRTGFYFLADPQDGVKMQRKNSTETFYIAKTPFASVDNIHKTKLEEDNFEGKPYFSLRMEFDAKGTEDLKAGTGHPLHPKLALVLANKLLYVVDNASSIKTGIFTIVLDGYSEQEAKTVRRAVEEKM